MWLKKTRRRLVGRWLKKTGLGQPEVEVEGQRRRFYVFCLLQVQKVARLCRADIFAQKCVLKSKLFRAHFVQMFHITL